MSKITTELNTLLNNNDELELKTEHGESVQIIRTQKLVIINRVDDDNNVIEAMYIGMNPLFDAFKKASR